MNSRIGMALGCLCLICMILASGCGYFVKPEGAVVTAESQAPDFSLPDLNGQTVSLEGLLKKGPVLVVFYRGHW